MEIYFEKLNFQSRRARKRKGGSEYKIFYLFLLYVKNATKYESDAFKINFHQYFSFLYIT